MPIDEVKNMFPMVVTGVGVVVWLIRLEGKINYSTKSIEKLETKHEALESKIVDKLSLIEKCLSKIEGRLLIDHKSNEF